MTKRMLIDATHHEETRVVVMEGNRLVEFDYESQFRRQLKGNIFLAKVTRVEPSLQAAFVNFGGNRHGFLPFSEIHPDYYRIPVADREELLAQQRAMEEEEAAREAAEEAEEEARAQALAADGLQPDEGDVFADAPMEMQTIESGAADNFYDSTATGPMAHEIQGEEGRELAAEEAGYVHDEVDLTPEEDAEASVPEAGTFISEDAILSAEVPEGEEGFLPDDETAGEAEGGESSGESQGGRRSWRRGGSGRNGRQGRGRYMGARSRRDERSEDSGPAGLHARFRRRYKIQEVIKRGQIMLVQVAKEERGNKGAAVTTYLSLPGRYCVLMPNSPRGGGISRKIGNFSDRRRLKDMLRALEIPSGMSVILRTAGVERTEAEIKRDYDYLLRLWDNIRNMTLQSSAPALIYEEGDLIKRSIRDIYSRDVDELLVAGEDGYNEARAFMSVLMPGNEDKIQHYNHDKIPLFQRYQIESQINEIGEPVVQLKSGGYIVINQTEALVAIDVNSGRATKERHIEETALKTNLEAADEVARQLRLRDLGGLVVIDFIDMEDRRNNAKVERRLKEALSSDRARIQLSRISTFGLLELSRQRLNPSLTEAQFQKCAHCHGFGFIRSVDSAAILALRALEEEGVRGRATQITLHVPNEIALYILNAKRDMLAAIEKRYGFRVMIHVDESLAPSGYVVEPMKAVRDEEDAQDDAVDEGDDGQRSPRPPRRKKPVAMEEAMEEQDDSAPESEPSDEGDEEGDVSDENFNRTDIEPDGARPRRRNGGRNRARGRDRGQGGGGRYDRAAPLGLPADSEVDQNGGDESIPSSVDRNPDRNNRRDGRGADRPRRGGGNRGKKNWEDRPPRAEPERADAPLPSAPSSDKSGGVKATYFVSRRRTENQEAMPASEVTMSAPVTSTPAQTESSTGPKKKGWWGHFS